MNPFSQANLSPLPIAHTKCDLPYSLTWADLRPALPGFDVLQEDKAQAWMSYAKQGLNGGPNSCVLTLDYRDDASNRRSVTVFIKSSKAARKAEAAWYRFLASRGVPTPRLFVAAQWSGAEVIVLEFLATIGINFESDADVSNLLDLLARLSAIQDVSEASVPKSAEAPPESATAYDVKVLAALTEASGDADLGMSFDVARWFEAYQRVQRDYKRLPQGLTHGEFYFQQIGWAQRGAGQQLVIFDLETMMMRPRFTDIAGVLPSLTAFTGRDQAGLLEDFLGRYCVHARTDVRFDEAMHEVRLARVADSFWSLPWHVHEARQPNTLVLDWRDMLQSNLAGIRDDLTALGFV